MNRFIAILLTLMVCFGAEAGFAQTKERSKSVVYINGSRYYVHSVESGDTLYSLSRTYGVPEGDILKANPVLGSGLRLGTNIKIPYTAVAQLSTKELSEKKMRKTFDQHTVVRGETLYSISRRYELSVEILMEDNTNLDPASLSVGQVLNIRKAEQGQTTQEQTQESIDNYRRRLNSVAPEGFQYYVVAEGVTVASVAAQFEMSEEQVRRANNLSKNFSRFDGEMMILVRDAKSKKASEAYTEEKREEIERMVESVSFQPLVPSDTLDIALLLPLSIRGRAVQPMAEFYQGFLLGVEDLKRRGRNVRVNLYNTERDSVVVRKIISQSSYQSCDLVVGPVYESVLDGVLRDAERRSIPVVSPLATINKSDSPSLFQVAPDAERRFEKMNDLLDTLRRVTLIRGVSNDEEFEAEVHKILSSRSVPFAIHNYEYEHPSVITDREREADNVIKALQQEMDDLAVVYDDKMFDSLRPPVSKSNLTPLIMGEVKFEAYGQADSDPDILISDISRIEVEGNVIVPEEDDEEAAEWLAAGEPAELPEEEAEAKLQAELAAAAAEEERLRNQPIFHTFFVMSDNEVEVDRILSALSSAYSAQLAVRRGSGRDFRTHIQFQVVANPAWRSYKNIDRTIYFRDRVVTFSSYLADRELFEVREFDHRYCEAYDELPSLYSYRGYDVVKIFGEGLYSDIMYDMGGRTYKPLQTTYRFERGDDKAKIVNTNWMKTIYNTDFSKKIE